jgi:hypothetical protein
MKPLICRSCKQKKGEAVPATHKTAHPIYSRLALCQEHAEAYDRLMPDEATVVYLRLPGGDYVVLPLAHAAHKAQIEALYRRYAYDGWQVLSQQAYYKESGDWS